MVLCTPVEGADMGAFRALLGEEADHLRALRDRGVLTSAWSPGRPGAVLLLDLDAEAASELAADLPLARAGLLATEVLALTPIEL